MKSIFILLLAALAFAATAQPQKIHYQGVAVGANGKPIKNSTVGLRLSVLDSLPTGSTLYTETQAASTDGAGQFSIFLGGGTATAGSFANLPWANGNDKFLKVEMDAQGGSNYQPMGTTQLVSVPYAMAAGSLREGTLLYGNNGMKFQITIDSAGPKWICYPPISIATAGPDQLNLIGNTVALSANTPATGETGAWSILSGNGGNLSSINNPTATFTKGTDSAYTLVWTITGTCGVSKDSVVISFKNIVMNVPCLGIPMVNFSGENYPTVQIGNQCWFAKNLNVGAMITGTSDQTNNGTLEKYCYNNDPAYCTSYGGLYQWAEAVQYQNGASNNMSPNPSITGKIQGICPTNWHIPSDLEWCGLLNNLDPQVNCGFFGTTGIVAGKLLKSISGWNNNNSNSNATGFTAVPSGYRNVQGSFVDSSYRTFYWSSYQTSPTQGLYHVLESTFDGIGHSINDKRFGFSIRCVKDTLCATTTSSAGPDQLSLTGTTATLAANAPAAGETGAWSILAGSGGSLSANNNPTATFTKGTDSAYTLIWNITGPCGTTTDTVNLLFPAPVGTACGQAVTYAGESYPTVQIGTQCWFAKNLNVGTMIIGISDQTNNSTLEKYCYNNDPANCTIYGGLYQWAEAVQYQNGASYFTSPSPAFTGNVRGICPTGWHLPSDAEYCTLTTFLDATVNCGTFGWSGTDAGGKMKSVSGLWGAPNTGAANSSGFSALPGGVRTPLGTFGNIGFYAYFWSFSEYSATTAFFRILNYNNSNIYRNFFSKSYGFSIRCTQD